MSNAQRMCWILTVVFLGIAVTQPPPSDYQAALQLQAQLVANAEPQPVLDAMAALVKALTPPARLLTVADLTWQYSFSPPMGPGGCAAFTYADGGFGYNPGNNSLFIGGTVAGGCANNPLVAEITIPPAGGQSSFIQNFADPSSGLDSVTNASGIRWGAFCPFNGGLLWSTYGNYDGSNKITVSLGQSTLNLAQPKAQGMYPLAATVDGKTVPNGAMDGWIVPVPAQWSGLFPGTTHFVGNGGINIISRTSAGPAAFGVNVNGLTIQGPNPATPYIYYPAGHYCPGFDTMPNVWPDTVRGMAAIANSQVYGMVYVGTIGLGTRWYGLAVTNPNDPNDPRNPPPGCSGTDPCSIYEGNHSQGKQPSVFIYDPNQVRAALHPYDPAPVISPLVWPGQLKCDTANGLADDGAGHLYVERCSKGTTTIHCYSYPH